MEEGDSILEALNEDHSLDDIEMVDVEEGEYVLPLGQTSGGDVTVANQGTHNRNRRRKANKKKKQKNKNGSGPNVTDINRFVLDTCRRLKEKKSYMVYTAVGCLGVSALSDILKEVDAIQTCGGQMTADGRRSRTGGGILWSIIKTREPNAYKEIMKKAKEFEKQFRQQNVMKAPQQKKEGSSIVHTTTDGMPTTLADSSEIIPPVENQHGKFSAEGKRGSVHDRIRIPVSYDDLLDKDPKDDSN